MTKRIKSLITKDQRFKLVIQHSIDTMYERMRYMLGDIDEETDLDADEQADETIKDVWAIEEEWILDPDLREEISMVKVEPDSDQ